MPSLCKLYGIIKLTTQKNAQVYNHFGLMIQLVSVRRITTDLLRQILVAY